MVGLHFIDNRDENNMPSKPEFIFDNQPQDDENAMLARSSMGGKKTAFLKAACSEELKEEVARKLAVMRAESGRTVSESEYIERVVAISLFGFEHVQMIEQEQLARLAGHWSNLGLSRAAA